MTQVKDMTDQQLNVLLAKMCGYEIYAEEFSVKYEVVVRYESPSSFKGLKFFIPCNDAADSLEVQAKAIEVDAELYMNKLAFIKGVNVQYVDGSRNHDDGWYIKVSDAALIANASPRERAEAAYITLQGAT